MAGELWQLIVLQIMTVIFIANIAIRQQLKTGKNPKKQTIDLKGNIMKKTLKNFIENSGINAKLIRAVIRQSGNWQSFQDMAPDIANHGISGGFSGWIYYTETCEFYAKNQALIVALIEQWANDSNLSPIDFVAGFNCFGADKPSIVKTLYGNKRQHDTIVANDLVWFAAESVAIAYNSWVNYGE